ncbi:hypothetical protein VNO77_42259 [Canavalia gladiata]|uniref:Uncharacterized protein n=1 Tax=Canavalia gladiata TaxID=3824 RepID=A0AAN9K0B8_CANGL
MCFKSMLINQTLGPIVTAEGFIHRCCIGGTVARISLFHIHAPTTTQDSDGDLLPFVLDALNEIAFNPKFLASRIEKERRAILSELQMMNTIEYRVDCLLLQHLHFENKLSLVSYWIEATFRQAGIGNEKGSVATPSAFSAMASFLVPKLSVGLGGNSNEKSADRMATIQACVKARSTIIAFRI